MDSENFDRTELAVPELDFTDPPVGSDRRTFMVRSAMATAIGLLGGTPNALWAQAAAEPPLQGKENPNLQVVKDSKGPVMTLVDEFYKVGPGPSSSHTIGPMRITYDFYQRAIKLPQSTLDQATALKVHLYGRDEDYPGVAEGHHLRRDQGRLSACQHNDRKADGRRQGIAGAGILFGRRRLHRMEGILSSQEEPSQISL
jgi:hypothetical protein